MRVTECRGMLKFPQDNSIKNCLELYRNKVKKTPFMEAFQYNKLLKEFITSESRFYKMGKKVIISKKITS